MWEWSTGRTATWGCRPLLCNLGQFTTTCNRSRQTKTTQMAVVPVLAVQPFYLDICYVVLLVVPRSLHLSCPCKIQGYLWTVVGLL